MITVAEASQIISSHTADFGVLDIPFEQCSGYILREDIFADRDFPPFDRVAMDGIAISFDTLKNSSSFPIAGMSAAGSPQQTLHQPGQCIEIMTGSILPLNTDTVIPYEWLQIENGVAVVVADKNVVKGQNVHRRGNDRQQGDTLISAGKSISVGDIGILASVGKTHVRVSKLPGVLVISTGNELVRIDESPLPHQVRMSNVYQIHAALKKLNIAADTCHIMDDETEVTNTISDAILKYDCIIVSGGISKGKFDHVPSVLESLGVQQLFYKVKQKPGKPFWFGAHPGGCTAFGIPGNPVSALMCYTRYIQPWIEKCIQKETPSFTAKLAEEVSFTSDLTQFLTVRLFQNENAEWIAMPVKGHGSGDLTVLTMTDGFIELPGSGVCHKGEVYPVYRT